MVRQLPVKELKRYIGFYETELQKVMSFFEKKELTFESLNSYSDYKKYKFLFDIVWVGHGYNYQLDDIESRIMKKTTHHALREWFENQTYYVESTRFVETHVIVEKKYFDEIETYCQNYK